MSYFTSLKRFLLFSFSPLLFGNILFGAEYFVSPEGDDSNSGSLEFPFATLQRGQEAVEPGDTVFIRGGTYRVQESQIARYESIWAYVNYLDKSGEEGAPINYFAYPGETPVFDYSDIAPADLRITAFFVKGSWIHLKGIELVGIQVTILDHTQSIGIENQGSHNIFEQVDVHDGQAIGFYLTRGSDNLLLNCDAYRNWDYTSENGKGGNVDGFGGHLRAGGTNNVFRGCRAWFNSDDGFDAINSNEAVVFENCWAFYNGYSSEFASLADGNGFKSGGHAGTAVDRLPDPLPRHVTRFCLAVGNKASGFYANHQIGGQEWFNNTAIGNTYNFNMLARLEDNATDVDGYGGVMRNNLGYGASLSSREVVNLNEEESDVSGNYFTLEVEVTADDFVSLDESLLTMPRQPNGDLPDIAYARLVKDSDLIDSGLDAGYAFSGSAPDLGAFEHDTDKSPFEIALILQPDVQQVRVSGPLGWPYSLVAANDPRLEAEDWGTVDSGPVEQDGNRYAEVDIDGARFFRLKYSQ
ncbi:right-handed parallel beta-helix repeat-containing protein [Pelagicoccus albus]|uniref:DUF4990 domain-containing protein n=1 Tax=Pelagicoccus albus TaxID=415222 RepID=A0A7X1B7L4_9BACT|nr:right-handed parallel beta-helix repeat-containing protein [Pelagicoccus albus]MBC2607154.1 DUF4990 domain-containing protein [Pelagicoccus albus]